MRITYRKAREEDIEPIYGLCRQLILDYEELKTINYSKVMQWVRSKIETAIDEYTVLYADGQKAGYYRFFKNENGEFEIDDLYIFPEFQNQGIGSEVIRKCRAAVDEPIMLYVFTRNRRAVSLYHRLGFSVSETVNGSRFIMRNNSIHD